MSRKARTYLVERTRKAWPSSPGLSVDVDGGVVGCDCWSGRGRYAEVGVGGCVAAMSQNGQRRGGMAEWSVIHRIIQRTRYILWEHAAVKIGVGTVIRCCIVY
jgi:hypothetical protein